jgi:pimeloyl-ACP methyl ester carboxylesterase
MPEDSGEQLAGLAAPDGVGFVDRLPKVTELPAWLSQDELDVYIEEFTRTGFTGGINWYRNFDRNWETTPQIADAHVTIPSTFITGAADPVNLMSPAGIMEGHALDHRGNTFVPGAGHWVQQEAAAEVNAALLAFLSSLDLGGR